ncbi:uncharacterized protein H6S33_012433, partial [Morchella sextelata]|uniref:uncharacterized protein n=1 Tax=Morchella sextelata TaxID=1174677 RepID=UPI001D0464DC
MLSCSSRYSGRETFPPAASTNSGEYQAFSHSPIYYHYQLWSGVAESSQARNTKSTVGYS